MKREEKGGMLYHHSHHHHITVIRFIIGSTYFLSLFLKRTMLTEQIYSQYTIRKESASDKITKFFLFYTLVLHFIYRVVPLLIIMNCVKKIKNVTNKTYIRIMRDTKVYSGRFLFFLYFKPCTYTRVTTIN